MNYKSLSLAALLLPFFGYGKNEACIKKLKEAQYQKSCELKELATQLRTLGYESYTSENIEYVSRKVVNIISKIPANKTKSEEEIVNRLEEENGALYEKLASSLINGSDFDIDIAQALLLENGDFDALKSIYVEAAVEEFHLRLIAEKFKKCLSEMWHINKEIKSLQS